MLKELKNLFFLLTVILFVFITVKYYFSDSNKKKSYRSLSKIIDKNINFSQELISLEDNTIDIIKYVKKNTDKNRKNYNFWKLIETNE